MTLNTLLALTFAFLLALGRTETEIDARCKAENTPYRAILAWDGIGLGDESVALGNGLFEWLSSNVNSTVQIWNVAPPTGSPTPGTFAVEQVKLRDIHQIYNSAELVKQLPSDDSINNTYVPPGFLREEGEENLADEDYLRKHGDTASVTALKDRVTAIRKNIHFFIKGLEETVGRKPLYLNKNTNTISVGAPSQSMMPVASSATPESSGVALKSGGADPKPSVAATPPSTASGSDKSTTPSPPTPVDLSCHVVILPEQPVGDKAEFVTKIKKLMKTTSARSLANPAIDGPRMLLNIADLINGNLKAYSSTGKEGGISIPGVVVVSSKVKEVFVDTPATPGYETIKNISNIAGACPVKGCDLNVFSEAAYMFESNKVGQTCVKVIYKGTDLELMNINKNVTGFVVSSYADLKTEAAEMCTKQVKWTRDGKFNQACDGFQILNSSFLRITSIILTVGFVMFFRI